MPLQSSKVAPGIDVTADQFNKLREDLLTNHDHSSGMGGTVDHGDLMETDSMAGMSHMHEDLDVHLNGGGPGPTDIDNPGGSMGVHSLHPSVYVAGILGSQQLVLMCGDETSSGTSGTTGFGTYTFGTCLGVTATIKASSGNPMDQGVAVHTLTTTGFSWIVSTDGGKTNGFYWIAWGTK